MDKVAIVILNWNGEKFLRKFLPGVINDSLTEGIKIYVADNGSKDNSIDYLTSKFPDEVKIIQLDKNYGFAGGYNRALQNIESKYYILLNSDIETTPDWIAPMYETMENHSDIGACMPKILAYHARDHFEYAGAAGGFIDKYGYPFCRGRILDSFEKDTGQYDDETEIFWATGACMFVRSDVFHKAGGFDDDFFAHMEEIDLCWKIKNLGYRITFTPRSKIYHVGGGTLPNKNPFKLYLNYRNNLYLLYKNLPEKEFNRLYTRMILDGFSALVYLVKLDIKSFMAVIKAHRSFYGSLKKLREKRKVLKQKGNMALHQEMTDKSIVYNYFVKGNKNYSDLFE